MTDPHGPPSTEPPEPKPPAERGKRGVALMLAIAALMAAAIATRASFLSSQASGTWQFALRSELKLGAAMIEDVRYVYNSEAPIAFAIARPVPAAG